MPSTGVARRILHTNHVTGEKYISTPIRTSLINADMENIVSKSADVKPHPRPAPANRAREKSRRAKALANYRTCSLHADPSFSCIFITLVSNPVGASARNNLRI
jgi:hypothetical protein